MVVQVLAKFEPEAGQAYDPSTFVDPEGFLAAVKRLEKAYTAQLAAERQD